MNNFLVLLFVIALAVIILRLFVVASPAQLAVLVRTMGGIVLLALAAFIGMRGNFAIAMMFAVFALALMFGRSARRVAGSGGQSSKVRSAGLEMVLDHDTGEMDGQILAGRYEGQLLSQLELPELLQVAEDFRDDQESLRLLESYLDRAHPGWRENVDDRTANGSGTAQGSGSMSPEEAYDILGLEPDASEAEIVSAHRRLMKQVHPDRGGSDALAAKINEAKDRLLGKHG